VTVTALTAFLVGSILVTVLGKPQWPAGTWIATAFAPGALGGVLGEVTAWLR
jgi:hypothetical protein